MLCEWNEVLGVIFFPFPPPLFFFLQRKHLFGVGMALIKIMKKVWKEKVNKAIHTSSGRDTGAGQRKITVLRRELGDFHESAP